MAKWLINPEHGGFDRGVISKTGIEEADIVLEVAMEVKRLLEKNGETVLLTRSTDTYVKDKEKIKLANTWKADFILTLGFNEDIDTNVKGSEIYINKKDGVEEELAKFIKSELVSNLRTEDRGIKIADYDIFRLVEIPSIIIKAEFLTNEEVSYSLNGIQYGKFIAKGCLNMVNKVLIDIPKKKPKVPKREGWRVCVGYYKDYEEAELYIIKMKNIGLKDVYVVPYPDEKE